MTDRPQTRATGIVHLIGLVMVWSGLGILAFAGYQVWFTDLVQQHSQTQLAQRVAAVLPVTASLPSGPPVPETTHRGTVPVGNWLGTIAAPTIGLSQVILEGTGLDQLRLGPGHYPDTPLPGEAGNVAIAGHRTTWGHPFRYLDQLRPGDPIVLTTVTGRYLYRVSQLRVVNPSDTSVVAPSDVNELTLTTCNPPYSAATRLVVRALLAASDRSTVTTQRSATNYTTNTVVSLNGGHEGWWPIFLCGEILVLLFGLSRRWWARSAHRPVVVVVTVSVAVPALLGLFNGISWLLPAGY
jgi:sortase A